MSYHWQTALQNALHRERSLAHSRYLQLATVDAAGAPRVRTVVFRAFEDNGDTLLAVTDRRSAKICDLLATPRAELCWYFVSGREQYRIAAAVRIHDGAAGTPALRSRIWDALSLAARDQFFRPAPGTDLGGTGIDREAEMPDSFCVLAFHAERVDHLMLTAPTHRRLLSEKIGGEWHTRALNP
jgi:PPOX class probable FMN-dependent enzyme